MKKYLVLLIVILSCMYPCKAFAANYDKTIDYRYNIGGYWDTYLTSGYTQWYQGREEGFEDSNSETFRMTTPSGTPYTTVTATTIQTSTDGSFDWSGNVVAGWSTSGKPYIKNLTCDYIYEVEGSTVDSEYTITWTADKPTEYRGGIFQATLYGIGRLDGGYNQLKSVSYTTGTPDNNSTYSYGSSITYEGSDGYNYKGFVIRINMELTSRYYLDGTTYRLFTCTNTLDTITPEVPPISDQLDNINGTLGSIYTAITNIPTTIVSSIEALPTTIINGIKHIFIYDDWEQDLRNMADEIEIPYVNQLVRDVGTILQYFTEYNPTTEIHIRIPKIVYNNGFAINGNMTNETIDIEDITEYSVDGYNIVTALRTVTSFGAMMFILSLAGKFLIQVGIEVDDYLHPVIKTVLDTGEVDI